MQQRQRIILTALLLCALVALAARPASAQMVWSGDGWVKPRTPDPGTPAGDLQRIRELLEQGENKDVADTVEQFLVLHGESPLCEEAMNLAGQALMNRGRYWDAYKWFQRQIDGYPNGQYFKRALDREYRIADAFLNGRKRRALKIFRVPAQDDGIEILMRIAAAAPGTALAERALIRVGDYHFGEQEYPEAIGVYEDFLKDFPLSQKRSYAMLQVAKSYLLSFRGIQWEAEPLRNADVRFRVFAEAYPQLAEQENVPAILEEIRLTLAHKLYHTAAFYERTHYPRAAAFYYQKTIDDYPDTHWAQSARGKLEQLGDVTPPKPGELPELTVNVPPPPSERDSEEPAEAKKPDELDEQYEPVRQTAPTDTAEKPPAETPRPQETAPIRLEELPTSPTPRP